MSEQQGPNLFPMNDDRCGIEATRDETIDRYLMEKMTASEKDAFLDHVLFCSDCNQELQRREGIMQSLAAEALSPETREKAKAVLHASEVSAWQTVLWRAAAVLLLVSAAIGAVWFTGHQNESAWADFARVDPSEANLQFMQSQDEPQWRSYNEAVALLINARESSWLTGARYDAEQVEQAMRLFDEIDSTSVPEDLRMDIAWYMIKANLMLEQPKDALQWLQRSVEIGVNRNKLERALEGCQQMIAIADQQNNPDGVYLSDALRNVAKKLTRLLRQ